MVAGIVLLALGLKKTLGHVEDPLKLVPAMAMLAGTAVYLLAHVAFRWRNVHRFSTQRPLCALPAPRRSSAPRTPGPGADPGAAHAHRIGTRNVLTYSSNFDTRTVIWSFQAPAAASTALGTM
jgi:hypothetical protein